MTNEEVKVVLKSLADNPLLSAEHITKALYKAIELVESQPCEDAISREEVIEALRTWIQYGHLPNGDYVPLDYLSNPEEYVAFVRFEDAETCINKMPPVSCTNLSNLYQNVKDWLSTFNTDSATECFTAVQELKKKLEGDTDAE